MSRGTVDEFSISYTVYRHRVSGAEVLSVRAPQDDNKVFAVSFQTPPTDSTGVPHILEHSVLCGSRRFPVKDPFVRLLRGSLHTFLNAFTYPDRTVYPAASRNLRDFHNLASVYLDAVFFPRAVDDARILAQEGWHFELDDLTAPLTTSGVVLNEMKGVYSSPDALMTRAAQRALFPDITYGVDSGGDPAEIPSLTFGAFRLFHATYYHPSSARVFFYGDDPEVERLELLNKALAKGQDGSGHSAAPPISGIRWQPPLLHVPPVRVPYPAAPPSPLSSTSPSQGGQGERLGNGVYATVHWMLNQDEPVSPDTALTLQVVDHLLLGTSASVLRKRLTDSGLGDAVVCFLTLLPLLYLLCKYEGLTVCTHVSVRTSSMCLKM